MGAHLTRDVSIISSGDAIPESKLKIQFIIFTRNFLCVVNTSTVST